MRLHSLDIPERELADFCRRHGVTRLAVFGSILRDDFGPDSDIDVLIDFAPDQKPSLFTLGGMQQELCDLLGRQVDLKPPGFMSDLFRDRVLREARTLYAA